MNASSHPPPAPNAARTYALVIAVSRYGYGDPAWDRDALDRDAERFAQCLHDKGVPPENVLVLKGGEATAERVRAALVEEVPRWGGDLLWVYWAGHGVIDTDQKLRLLLAGRPATDRRNLRLEDLLKLYQSAYLPGFAQQNFVVDACQQSAEDLEVTVSAPLDLPPPGAGRDVDQGAWLATQLREPAAYGPQGGLFSAAVRSSLHGAAGLGWRPTLAKLQQEVDAEAEAFDDPVRGVVQKPIRMRYADTYGMQDAVVALASRVPQAAHPLSGPAVLPPVAHRMAVPPAGSTSRGAPDERFRVRLETRWCLTPGAFTDVLADPAGDDLALLLSEAERVLYRARAALPTSNHDQPAPRRWYVYENATLREPGTRSELLGALPGYAELDPDRPGRGNGLVVRVRSGDRPPAGWSACLEQLRLLMPELNAVVLQVHGAGDEAVRQAAVAAARDLRCDEYLVRQALPPARDTPPGGRTLTRAAEVLTLLQDVAAAAVRLDAAAIVADLNTMDDRADSRAPDDSNDPGPRGAWGDWRAERDILESVAARWPAAYPDLVQAHAAGRMGAGRYASLLLASHSDAELSRWLGAAGRRLPRPADFPGVLPPPVADAVVLGLLRNRERERLPELHGWQEASLSAAVRTTLKVAFRATSLGLPDIDRPEEAVALDRAGLLAATDLWELDIKGRCRGTWTLLTRRPLTEDTAAWLVRVPEPKRRLVGLAAPEPAVLDAALERDMDAYRDALRPPLPRH